MVVEKQTSNAASEIKSLWASRNKVIDNNEKENAEMNENAKIDNENFSSDGLVMLIVMIWYQSGFLYDRLQKEVISLRKYCDLKDSTLNAKDDQIKMLMKKIETLTRAIEVELKKTRRELSSDKREGFYDITQS
ncbi:hypothetical protein RD792_005501 [Penstemon davidsonii]|uniref:Uncharacterized protein n=1 Tax=Penstemon davidsonii TaxID=160366 RepID=A0ABR0DWC2_9LAMI|nr:hypothetical protein RD792_005501 [Penstemon davidsonii]